MRFRYYCNIKKLWSAKKWNSNKPLHFVSFLPKYRYSKWNRDCLFIELFLDYLLCYSYAFLFVLVVRISWANSTLEMITLTSENFYQEIYKSGREGNWIIMFTAPVLLVCCFSCIVGFNQEEICSCFLRSCQGDEFWN